MGEVDGQGQSVGRPNDASPTAQRYTILENSAAAATGNVIPVLQGASDAVIVVPWCSNEKRSIAQSKLVGET